MQWGQPAFVMKVLKASMTTGKIPLNFFWRLQDLHAFESTLVFSTNFIFDNSNIRLDLNKFGFSIFLLFLQILILATVRNFLFHPSKRPVLFSHNYTNFTYLCEHVLKLCRDTVSVSPEQKCGGGYHRMFCSWNRVAKAALNWMWINIPCFLLVYSLFCIPQLPYCSPKPHQDHSKLF